MSGTNGDRERPVNIMLGGASAPVTTDTDSFYRDYIIHNNRELTSQLSQLTEELSVVRQERDDLEEQANRNESKNINLKQHVKNFRDQAELYRAIANADHRFFRDYLQAGRDARLRAEGKGISQWINPSDHDISTVLMVLMLMIQLYFSVAINFTLSVLLITGWIMRPEREHTALVERMRVEAEIAVLIDNKNAKKAELDKLKRTLDIVGTAVDNLET